MPGLCCFLLQFLLEPLQVHCPCAGAALIAFHRWHQPCVGKYDFVLLSIGGYFKTNPGASPFVRFAGKCQVALGY
jgi:hypothetical protein